MHKHQYVKVEKGIGNIDKMLGDIYFSIQKPTQTLEQIKNKLAKNSETLLLSRNQFIENRFIELPEKEEVLQFIKDTNSDDNILILTGRAGNGKTALLSELQQILKNENSLYLSIKSDSFTVTSKESLSNNFEIDDLHEAIVKLSKKEHVVILIDQLDALSLTLSSNREPINIILEFIQSLKGSENINIVVSIREYDLKNDPLLKKINDTNKITMDLLSEEIVKDKLNVIIKKHGALPKTLLELLRTPLHLSLFLELNFEDASHTTIKTLQDLYQIFWKQKILDKTVDKELQESTIELIDKIIVEMNSSKKIEVPKLYFEDDYSDAIYFLKSNHILLEQDNKFTFFHQTFYDYIFARKFVKSRKSLFKYISNSDQSIEIRERIKQIVEFLRATEPEKCLKQLGEILYSENIRFHIKLLIISYLGNIDNPSEDEFTFLHQLFEEDEKFLQYFLESWISVGWLKYFYQAGYFTKEYLETYNLKYRPQVFINKDTDLVLEILENYPEIDNKNEAITLALSHLEVWDSRAFKLFLNNHKNLKEDKRVDHWYGNILKKLINYDIDFVIKKVFENIFSEIDYIEDFGRKELFEYDLYDIFKKVLEKEPIKVVEHSLSTINKIIIKTQCKQRKEYLIDDTAFGESEMWQFNFGSYYIWRFYKKILDELLLIAEKDNTTFLRILQPYKNSQYINLLAFSIFGYSTNPQKYKNEIFQLFTNERLLEEIQVSFDIGYKLMKLLKVSFLLFDDEEKKNIINTITKINPKWEMKHFRKKYSGNSRGYYQYIYFLQLPVDDISRFGYFKVFQELQRKFHDYKEKEPYKSHFSFAEAPIDKEVYEKMNLEALKQSMIVFDKKRIRKRNHDSVRSGMYEHSRQFHDEVKNNPDRFYSFLFEIKDDVSADYLSSGLNGLVEVNYSNEKVIELLKCYMDVDDRYLQQSIIRAIEKLMQENAFNPVFIDIFENYKDIEYEGFKSDKELQSIHDHMSTSINSTKGVLAKALPYMFKYVCDDFKNKERVVQLLKEVIADENDYVKFGLVRTIDQISKLDTTLYLSFIMDLIEQDKSGQITLYLLKHLNYLVINAFITYEDFFEHLSIAINYISSLEDDNKSDASDYGEYLGMLLFFNYTKKQSSVTYDLLNHGIETNENIIKGIVSQAFSSEIVSSDETRVNLAKKYILKFKDDESAEGHYQYSLEKLYNLKLIENDFKFVTELAKSISIQKDSRHFWEYLKHEYYQNFTLSDKILDIIETFLSSDNSDADVYYYRDTELIAFILELYSRAKIESKKIKCLDLMDQFLMSDKYRNSTKELLEQ